MKVIDTNILFPLIVRGQNSERAHQLYAHDPDWRTEAIAIIEFSNILVTYERQKLLSADEARTWLHEAEDFLQGRVVNVSNHTALDIALEYRITTYDARFVALAIMHSSPLITEDRKVRLAAPKLTLSLDEAIASFR